jgi:hypothetical protein
MHTHFCLEVFKKKKKGNHVRYRGVGVRQNSLCAQIHHKGLEEYGCEGQHILKAPDEGKLHHRTLYTGGNNARTHCARGWVGPTAHVDMVQRVSSHFTDSAISTHTDDKTITIFHRWM